mmetsp:Transcript_2598/g.6049  ORF Transcript_2598/g.6049 Transcript_2598/m.6049 type:complete len:513 (-) Transcript_2598:56-1594(-)
MLQSDCGLCHLKTKVVRPLENAALAAALMAALGLAIGQLRTDDEEDNSGEQQYYVSLYFCDSAADQHHPHNVGLGADACKGVVEEYTVDESLYGSLCKLTSSKRYWRLGIQFIHNFAWASAAILCTWILWNAPWPKIIKWARKQLRNVQRVWPYVPDLLPYAPTMLPYTFDLLPEINRLVPLVDSIMKEKEYLLPVLPELLPYNKELCSHLDLLAPYIHELAPHSRILLAHADMLLAHVDEMAPYIDKLILILRVRGWDASLNYVEDILPFLPEIAPHIEKIAVHLDILLPHLHILVKYLPYMDIGATLKVLDNLVPLISLLPVVDQSGVLYSRFICKQLPTVAKVIPAMPHPNLKHRLLTAGVSPEEIHGLPPLKQPFRRNKLPFELDQHVPRAHFKITHATRDIDDRSIVRYCVVYNHTHALHLRYSELRVWHKEIDQQLSNYCRLKLLEFPDKTFLGHKLSNVGVERRRVELEAYLQSLASHHDLLCEESPAYLSFLRMFRSSPTFTKN